MKHIITLLSAILLLVPWTQAQETGDAVAVDGIVINSVDGEGLTLCVVQLFQDGVCRARTVSDYAGRYHIPSISSGSYNILVVQFGDTLCHYKGLSVDRNTLIRHFVYPPANITSVPTIDYGLGIRMLRPATVRLKVKNLLEPLGLLITSPNDSRLWNYSGQLLAGPANEDISWPGPGGGNPFLALLTLVCPGLEPSWKNCDMKNELLIYGRILDYEASSDTTGKKRD